MKERFYTISLYRLLKQRNRMFIVGCLLASSNLFMGMTLFFSSERVVIVPACVSKSFWVDRSAVSAEYLEEMALFFAHQILDVSAASASYQRDIVLRYTATSYHNALKKRLTEEETRAREGQISTSFKPVQIKVDEHRLEAELTGDLLSYVGGKLASQARETYLLRFQYQQGRLLVTHFTLKKDASHEHP